MSHFAKVGGAAAPSAPAVPGPLMCVPGPVHQWRIRGFRAAGETRHMPEVSWALRIGTQGRYPYQKTEKSVDLTSIFREWPHFVF